MTTAKYIKGEHVRFNGGVWQVTGHTDTVSRRCTCGTHHYDLRQKQRDTLNVCGSKITTVTQAPNRNYPQVGAMLRRIAGQVAELKLEARV